VHGSSIQSLPMVIHRENKMGGGYSAQWVRLHWSCNKLLTGDSDSVIPRSEGAAPFESDLRGVADSATSYSAQWECDSIETTSIKFFYVEAQGYSTQSCELHWNNLNPCILHGLQGAISYSHNESGSHWNSSINTHGQPRYSAQWGSLGSTEKLRLMERKIRYSAQWRCGSVKLIDGERT